jgi:hypothetical protein
MPPINRALFNPVIGESTNSAALEELRRAVLSQPQNALPPAQEIGLPGQIALGILGGVDPEAFKTVVLPLLREQSLRGQLTEKQAAERRDQNIRALQSLAGLESAEASREHARGIAEQNVLIRQEAEARLQQESERKVAIEAQEATDRRTSFETLANKSGDLLTTFAEMSKELVASQERDERIAGATLASYVQGIGFYLNKLNPNDPNYVPDYRPTKIDVDGFQTTYDDATHLMEQIQSQAAGRRQAAIGAEAAADRKAAPKPLNAPQNTAIGDRLDTIRGVNQIFGRLVDLGDEIRRGTAYELIPKTVAYKEWRADHQGLQAEPRRKIIGVAQAERELGNIDAFLTNPGSFSKGDYENVRAGTEALQIKVFREAISQLDTLEAGGHNVTAYRKLFEREFENAPPRVQAVIGLPPEFPAGSIVEATLPDGSKKIRVYDPNTDSYLPEPIKWTPYQRVQ